MPLPVFQIAICDPKSDPPPPPQGVSYRHTGADTQPQICRISITRHLTRGQIENRGHTCPSGTYPNRASATIWSRPIWHPAAFTHAPGGWRQQAKSALAQPRSNEYGRNSRIGGFRPLGTSARTLEKRALQEVGGFEATSAETPFDAAYCHRAGHRSVGNHRL